MRISVERRRDHIIDLLKERERIRVSTLSRKFGVSEVVIRKDLKCLEERPLECTFSMSFGHSYLCRCALRV